MKKNRLKRKEKWYEVKENFTIFTGDGFVHYLLLMLVLSKMEIKPILYCYHCCIFEIQIKKTIDNSSDYLFICFIYFNLEMF
jgi:hypothetical protein